MRHDGTTQFTMMELKQITARFEDQWKTGPRPRLREYINIASRPARHTLLLELIGIDVDYRLRAGENPSIKEYKGAFPELSDAEVEMLTTRSQVRTATTLDPEIEAEGIVRAAQDTHSTSSPSERFKKIEEIGRGGMGSVWRAIQLSTGREVALKELPASSMGSTIARSRFEEEIHWASRLQHPNIARVYDSGLLEGHYFYAMELIHGERLDVYARGRQWTVRQMLEMMSMIAKAVQYAHERSILHRDLKPSNILVTAEGKPIIVDFGLARLVRNVTGDRKARQSEAIGTPAYMAPEQAEGRDDLIGRPTDVYSLGVMLYQFATGVLPHSFIMAPDTWRQRIAEEKIRPAREINPDIGKDLDALIMKCLAKNPEDRYADAQQLGADIDRLLEGMELQARPLNWSGRIKSWCCRPARLLQVGNLSITTGACFAPFHLLAICLGIAQFLGVPVPGFDRLRLREFIPLMTCFLLFDTWLLYSGFLMRRNRIWALWLNLAIVLGWLFWCILVLLGIVRFDTGGAVPSMAARLPVYIIFIAFSAVGSLALCLAIAAHYAQAYLDRPSMTDPFMFLAGKFKN